MPSPKLDVFAANDAQAIEAEKNTLTALAASLIEIQPSLADEIDPLIARFHADTRSAAHPYDAETAAERFTHALRRAWLAHAARRTGATFRSPTQDEVARLERSTLDAFGYERDFRPETLEQRCADFFPPPPRDWAADHILYSSGQAALTNVLLALDSESLFAGRTVKLAHLGAYFETRALVDALPALVQATTDLADADVVLIEPVCCNGAFASVDVEASIAALAAAPERPRLIVFDSTLLGRADRSEAHLARLSALNAIAVLRIHSGLKLFQAGFELANIGVLSVFARNDLAPRADLFRRLRTLTGAGLRLADAAALEAPWFLDAALTQAYEDAIFAHNAALASAVAADNQIFAPVSHPSLTDGAAPYCVFQLREPSADAYAALETAIATEAHKRLVLLDQGGSFGFRGHRFEIVRPETGEPPFLRVAMGARAGWSCKGVIALMHGIAAAAL